LVFIQFRTLPTNLQLYINSPICKGKTQPIKTSGNMLVWVSKHLIQLYENMTNHNYTKWQCSFLHSEHFTQFLIHFYSTLQHTYKTSIDNWLWFIRLTTLENTSFSHPFKIFLCIIIPEKWKYNILYSNKTQCTHFYFAYHKPMLKIPVHNAKCLLVLHLVWEIAVL